MEPAGAGSRVAAIGFWNDIDDAIRSTPEQPPTTPPVFRKQNLDELRTRGVEARILLRPHPRFDFSVGYTYNDTDLVDSDIDLDQLPNTPRNVFDASTTLTLPVTETSITVQARWRDRAVTETLGTGTIGFGSSELSEPSLFVDMRVLQPLRPGIDVYVDFDNMGDQRVEDSYPVRGRTFFVGLRARFDTTDEGGTDATNGNRDGFRSGLAAHRGGGRDGLQHRAGAGGQGHRALLLPAVPPARASTAPLRLHRRGGRRRSQLRELPRVPAAAARRLRRRGRGHARGLLRARLQRLRHGLGRPAVLQCHEVLEAWSEDSLTWNNKPDIGAAFDTLPNLTALGPLSCDATELVQDWLSGVKENNGIALTNATDRLIGMYSFEAADAAAVGKKAKLVIETDGTITEDLDGDCVADAEDNCPAASNNLQQDGEGDGAGDACDVCPTIFDPAQTRHGRRRPRRRLRQRGRGSRRRRHRHEAGQEGLQDGDEEGCAVPRGPRSERRRGS